MLFSCLHLPLRHVCCMLSHLIRRNAVNVMVFSEEYAFRLERYLAQLEKTRRVQVGFGFWVLYLVSLIIRIYYKYCLTKIILPTKTIALNTWWPKMLHGLVRFIVVFVISMVSHAWICRLWMQAPYSSSPYDSLHTYWLCRYEFTTRGTDEKKETWSDAGLWSYLRIIIHDEFLEFLLHVPQENMWAMLHSLTAIRIRSHWLFMAVKPFETWISSKLYVKISPQLTVNILRQHRKACLMLHQQPLFTVSTVQNTNTLYGEMQISVRNTSLLYKLMVS